MAQLRASIDTDFPSRYRKRLSRSIDLYFPRDPRRDAPSSTADADVKPKSMMDYRFIHQTDKVHDGGTMSSAWREMNAAQGWKHVFYDDARATTWIGRQFRASEVARAWQGMRRGVLRADFFRYLVVLVQGGVVRRLLLAMTNRVY